MLANSSDGLLFHVPHLPRVQMRTIFLCTLTTLAREVDTNQLRHILGEDVDSLHIRLVKEKHSHIANVAFGRIGNRRTTGLLQTLVCWGPLLVSPIRRRHGRITLRSLSTSSILSSSTSIRSLIIEGWRANLHIIHRIDFVLVNAAPAEDDWGVGRLREVNLSDEGLHDPQCLGQRSGVELRDRTSHGHDVDVGEVLRKIRK